MRHILNQFKIPVILFLLGIVVSILGAWMKIIHMAYADGLLTAGMLVKGISVVMAIAILIKTKH